MVVRIWAKLSDFVHEYSRNLFCELKWLGWFNRYSTLNFNIHFFKWTSVAQWVFTNYKSNFAQLFINSSNVSIISVRCLKFTLHLHRVFTMSVFTSCSNKRSKSVAKWYNCHINELVKQIILYRPQNGFLARNDVGQLWHVSLIVFHHNIPQMITHWHIDSEHLLLFLHQNRCVVICSLRKLYF